MTRMEFKDINKTKLFALGLGGLLGLSHLSMIGLLAQRESKFPKLDLPVSEYTSYEVEAGEDGYRVRYRSNDPLVMHTSKIVPGKGGLFGKGQSTEIIKQYTMDGAEHHDGPVSTRTSWIDPAGLTGEGEKKPSAKTIECIKQEEVVKVQGEWSVGALVLLLVLVSPLYLLLVGFWLVLLQ